MNNSLFEYGVDKAIKYLTYAKNHQHDFEKMDEYMGFVLDYLEIPVNEIAKERERMKEQEGETDET